MLRSLGYRSPECDVVKDVLYSNAEIQQACARLAKRINDDYGDQEVIVVALMNGGVPFTIDLTRHLLIDHIVKYIKVSSYGDGYESGSVKIDLDLKYDIKGKHVLLIDDLVDTGNSMAAIIRLFKTREPKSLEICVLVDKKPNRKHEIDVKVSWFCVK